jgi:hypothetical protein
VDFNRADCLTTLATKLPALSQARGEVLTCPTRDEHRTQSFRDWFRSTVDATLLPPEDFTAVPVKDSKH